MRAISKVAVAAAFATLCLAGPAEACVCVLERVSVNEPSGRVFALSPTEAVGGATVQLKTYEEREIVAEVATAEDGSFRLPPAAAGRYLLHVSMPGFMATELQIDLKKRMWGKPRGVAVRLDIPSLECTCGDGCAISPRKDGQLSPACLEDRAREEAQQEQQ